MIQFYLLGDMGSGEVSQYLVSRALKNHIGNKTTFVCGLGDNIYEEGCTGINDKQFITKFEKPYGNISDKINSICVLVIMTMVLKVEKVIH